MLAKMVIHGLVAAILIGGAAAVYAQAKDNGYLSAAPAQARTDGVTAAQSDNGYLKSPADGVRKDKEGRKHAVRSERLRDGRGHDNDRDDD
jgi:hypothetical protein